jgi:hypothetical protein
MPYILLGYPGPVTWLFVKGTTGKVLHPKLLAQVLVMKVSVAPPLCLFGGGILQF